MDYTFRTLWGIYARRDRKFALHELHGIRMTTNENTWPMLSFDANFVTLPS